MTRCPAEAEPSSNNRERAKHRQHPTVARNNIRARNHIQKVPRLGFLASQGKTKVEAKGKIKIPDLSEETFADLEMTVLCDDETAEKKPLKEAMRTTGVKRVREACAVFVAELKVVLLN